MAEKWGSGGPRGAGTGPAAPRPPPPWPAPAPDAPARRPADPERAPAPGPARSALVDGMKLAAAVMSPRRAEEAEGPPGSPARLV